MTRLKSSEIAKRDKLADDLEAEKAKLEDMLSQFNDRITKELEAVNATVRAFNEKVQAVEAFREDMHNTMEEHFEGRSESWQGGDGGQAYGEWRDSWADSFEEIPEFEVEEILMPDEPEEMIDALRELAIEPS